MLRLTFAAVAAALAAILLLSPAAAGTELTLPQAIDRALAADPRLQAADAQLAAAAHRIAQAGRRPNPTLNLELENFGGTGALAGFAGSELTAMLGWSFDLGGKRAAGVEVAAAMRDRATAATAQTRLAVIARTRAAFAAVLAKQSRLELLAERQALDAEVRADLRRRAAVGAAASLDTLRAALAAGTTAVEIARARSELAAARRQLAACWNAAAPDYARANGALTAGGGPRPLGVLLDELSLAPALRVQAGEQQMRVAETTMATRARRIDVDVGLGLRFENQTGERGLVLALGLPLPAADRGADALAAARAEVRAGEYAGQAAYRDLAANLVAGWERLDGLHREALALEELLLPVAEALYAEARQHLHRGRLSLTDVLAVRSDLLQLQDRRLDLLEQYHMTAAELTGLTGLDLLDSAAAEVRP
ncbi:MAG: TolC family protein [Candidatus Krumholzibacteria bacterium]|jgi:cobalt-zinc-cadmium efflux system outer membrane protein|nr:TolC family protein [Candidatus Krumholzibacteria bacterium]